MAVHTTWHGAERYFGLHYDLHANEHDTELGTKADPELLVPMLELMAPQFVQTDCKGHPGYTSWFSTTKDASVPPGLTHDALAQWRDATRRLDLPLHCHYSGLWDSAAGEKHPEWAVKTADGEAAGAPFGKTRNEATNDVMCPRSPYIDELLIPQFRELIDRYNVDGFWVDGEIWAAKPCYCERCRTAWQEESGEADAPANPDDPRWPEWMAFVRHSFRDYVTRYCDAVHRHRPGVLVCSNWLQTFKDPGEPTVPTDWISGDNSWVYGLDQSRCEGRFLSTRKKHWDIMLWAFYCSHGHGNPESPMTFKPEHMLMQEASVLAAFGGNVQIYEHPPLRDGRLVPWRQRHLRNVGAYIKRRRPLCQNTETIPQIAVLHSEHHLHATISGPNLLWNVDTKPVEGAVYALLENSYGVDVLDEWALLPRIQEFPVVVVPEQDSMSDEMARRLIEYVRAGGSAVVSGAGLFERLGADVVGAEVSGESARRSFALTADCGGGGGDGDRDGDVPVYSNRWLHLEPVSAVSVCGVWDGTRLPDRAMEWPGAVLNRFGEGRLLYIPADLFRSFCVNRYPGVRRVVGALLRSLGLRFAVRAEAPTAVDVALRRQRVQLPGGRDGTRTIVHLLNRSSGIPNQPNNGAIDEIPAAGPVSIRIDQGAAPKAVYRAYEAGELTWRYDGGCLWISVPFVHIHEAVVVE